jgi:hypothetical protein
MWGSNARTTDREVRQGLFGDYNPQVLSYHRCDNLLPRTSAAGIPNASHFHLAQTTSNMYSYADEHARLAQSSRAIEEITGLANNSLGSLHRQRSNLKGGRPVSRSVIASVAVRERKNST